MKQQYMMAAGKKMKQAGFTMVEFGLVLVIGAILIVGIFSKFSANTSATQTNQLTGDLTTLMGQVKSSYANNYSAVTNAKLDSGSFFKNLNSLNDNAGSVTTNLGGGSLTVSSGTVNTAGDSVSYVVTQLPDSSCVPFVTAMSKTVTKLSVGTNVVKAPGTNPDPSQIKCSGDNNSITMLVQ
ncbi:type II secretion system protein [Undibacterium oligocarboniphilum]|uniref:Type 4 secretion system PilS N-terminal domain-containing protein n=1 Tax=Undibacterium oligocarboniphilum TaxID=666702 RepID=A0A850QIP8_9BURK|nr:prepilin-type N-terminal cleavage/methylation domain-containing protein [Undibacterium oligocarboniphilum]MBC3871447.1 hypothetical protein [Undibacterium oligocarboniphilum]NVO78977.1 hypothetical protein [Undibacterium oligocarboniphilum]